MVQVGVRMDSIPLRNYRRDTRIAFECYRANRPDFIAQFRMFRLEQSNFLVRSN